jgi:hypothetical protein
MTNFSFFNYLHKILQLSSISLLILQVVIISNPHNNYHFVYKRQNQLSESSFIVLISVRIHYLIKTAKF